MFVNAKLRFVVGVVTTLPRILDQLYLAEHLGQVVFLGITNGSETGQIHLIDQTYLMVHHVVFKFFK